MACVESESPSQLLDPAVEVTLGPVHRGRGRPRKEAPVHPPMLEFARQRFEQGAHPDRIAEEINVRFPVQGLQVRGYVVERWADREAWVIVNAEVLERRRLTVEALAAEQRKRMLARQVPEWQSWMS